MRILAVSHTAVWPVRSGSANRRLTTLRALARFGTVDLLYVGQVEDLASRTPGDAPVERVLESRVERRRPGAMDRARWLLNPRVPYQMIEWAETVQPSPLTEAYDLIWYFRPITYELARGIMGRRRIVDLDDLEDDKLRQSRNAESRRGPWRRRLAEWRNMVAWERYQRAIARDVDSVTVCKEMDRRTLSVDNCFVLPNGFPEAPVAGDRAPRPPVLLFVGLFSYGPNADAAEFCVDHVFPRVRSALPDVRLRLVGRNAARVRQLAREGVEVVGEVDDLTPEYERAAAALVPIRIQSGTRVKILEAFARRVPVVSTTAGAAGLEAAHGDHLLIADDARGFAEACVALVNDDSLRATLTDRAYELYRTRFSQDAVTASVRLILERTAVPDVPDCIGARADTDPGSTTTTGDDHQSIGGD